ncbi:MAG: hypothetical protein RMJ98_05220 [Myxococcales bacterium]|nr:hypothetical protein [Polyangiaceae bacterium]MDW8248690.1 hypothetical protein [Myxococcales bacterium]
MTHAEEALERSHKEALDFLERTCLQGEVSVDLPASPALSAARLPPLPDLLPGGWIFMKVTR